MLRVIPLAFALAISFFLAISFAPPAVAGKFNPTRSIGDRAPAWKELPGIDGKKHSLDDLKDRELVVVVFTCNSCDVARDYEDRILALAKKYAGPDGRVALVAINANTIPEDSLEKMKERAEERGFPFPYLFDGTQETARAFGATWTPEFFVLDRERKIRYMGAMDDTSVAALAKEPHLEHAIEALLSGKVPETAETPAIGCAIRSAKVRRTRQP